MKLVFVIGIMGNGGAERVIANLSNAFTDWGWKIHIVTIYGNRQEYSLNDGIQVHSILCKSRFRIFRLLERIRLIRKIVKSISPDFAISFLADVNIHVIVALIGLKSKLIICERNDPNRDPSNKWIRKLRNLLYTRVKNAVFQTQDALKYFHGILPPDAKVAIIPNPIKKDLPTYNIIENHKRFITACRLNEQKNLYMMIEAFAKVIRNGYNYTLEIYGEGPMKEELQEYINKLEMKSHISLCGFSHEIHNIMATSAGFVISSDYEGISNSMLEALAIGVPVIATDCPIGGARMYVKNGKTGHLVPCGDVDSLVEAIEDVINRRQEAIEMGKNATVLKRTLDSQEIAKDWKAFIDSI